MITKEVIGRYDIWDIYLIMLASISLAYFAVTVPSFSSNVVMQWVHGIHWGWFLLATILLAARPKMKMWAK